ncbi:hypothetical protein VTO73DRAFT_129 [Trametes versicolor]
MFPSSRGVVGDVYSLLRSAVTVRTPGLSAPTLPGPAETVTTPRRLHAEVKRLIRILLTKIPYQALKNFRTSSLNDPSTPKEHKRNSLCPQSQSSPDFVLSFG